MNCSWMILILYNTSVGIWPFGRCLAMAVWPRPKWPNFILSLAGQKIFFYTNSSQMKQKYNWLIVKKMTLLTFGTFYFARILTSRTSKASIFCYFARNLNVLNVRDIKYFLQFCSKFNKLQFANKPRPKLTKSCDIWLIWPIGDLAADFGRLAKSANGQKIRLGRGQMPTMIYGKSISIILSHLIE